MNNSEEETIAKKICKLKTTINNQLLNLDLLIHQNDTIKKTKLKYHETKSKYFTSKDHKMDTDLDDSKEFVEKKVTKNVVKKEPKVKPRKRKVATKKTKSEDLRKYVSDFNKVCEANNLDVDPEELQLTIALSESLAEFKSDKGHSATQSSSNKSNIDKIRKTLEEFGFKTNNPGINLELTKKQKYKRKRDYQLIKHSQQQKREKVADLLSQILLESIKNDISHTKYNKHVLFSDMLRENLCQSNCCYHKNQLCFKVALDELQNYYIHNLIVPSSSRVGCLLRDWSMIPGREKSPERPIKQINIQEHPLFKDNFDLLLTGTHKSINAEIKRTLHNSDIAVETCSSHKVEDIIKKSDTNQTEVMIEINSSRSNSPDIFADTYESYNSKNNSINDIKEDNDSDDDLPDVYFGQSVAKSKLTNVCIDLSNADDETIVSNCSNNSSKSHDFTGISRSQRNEDSSEYSKSVNLIENDCLKQYVSNLSEDDECSKKSEDESMSIKCKSDDSIEYSVSYSIKDENDILNQDSTSRDSIELNKCDDISNQTISSENSNDLIEKKNISECYISYKESEQTCFSKDKSNVNDESNDCSYNYKDSVLSQDKKGIIHYESFAEISLIESEHESNDSISDKLDKSYHSNTLKCNNSDINDSINKHNSLQESTESSQVFVISDDELDYSVNKIYQNNQSKFHDFMSDEEFDPNSSQTNRDDCDHVMDQQNNENRTNIHTKMYRSSILDTIYSTNTINEDRNSITSNINSKRSIRTSIDSLPDVNLDGIKGFNMPLQIIDENSASPKSDLYKTMINDQFDSPDSKYVLKTGNVTPLMDYNSLGSPEIAQELSKYGLKKLKRKRAVQILEHIYEQTHPTVNFENFKRERKKRKIEECSNIIENKTETVSKDLEDNNVNTYAITNNVEDKYKKDCIVNNVRYVIDEPDDIILPSREKLKVHSCSVPLHIAFHNYIAARSKLKDAILRYEPIDIEMVHKDLKATGYNYKPQDLMKYMDKKCITIKINAKDNKTKK